ncbi:MAG: DUF1576 domain-containing protein [Oscillospiraceae bacterium]|nr:DUF1576 domain-containing protein [Oscillospiraceae bacterium]
MYNCFKSIHNVYFITILILLAGAVILEPSLSLFEGFVAILHAPDILVTDYVLVGGLGSAILNSALTSMVALSMLIFFKHEAKSATISNLWLIMGFAFFGKNPLNMLPIFFGGWLYAKFMKQDFNMNILTCLVAASLSPAVTQKVFIAPNLETFNIVFSIAMGIFIGFIFDPMAKNIFKAHDGFNLYNGGFTAGMLAIIITSVFSSYNITYQMNDQWSSGNNFAISVLVYTISAWLIFVGLYMHRDVRNALTCLFSLRDHHNDYYPVHGYVVYVNMGVLGIFCTTVALVLGMEINGLVLGAILSVMGFGANGKQIYSVSSLMAGVAVATLLSPLELLDPGVSVAFFFVACLSPIPAKFGWHWGVVAGAVHVHLATSLAVPSGGINLYNNGVAAGFATVLLLPIIRAIHARKELSQHKVAK